MNILFYTTNEVAPQYGGVERVTANIANAPDITSGNSATTAPSAKSAALRDRKAY